MTLKVAFSRNKKLAKPEALILYAKINPLLVCQLEAFDKIYREWYIMTRSRGLVL